MFSLKGKLKVKNEEQVLSEKFKKREFVLLDDSSQYPQTILFQLTQERTNLLDSFNEGDEMTVHFNLRGREWTSPQGEVKYFNSLEVWRIEAEAAGGAPAAAPTQIPSAGDVSGAEEEDDLPF